MDHSVARDDIVQMAVFTLGAEEYVVDIMRVREIVRPLPITPIRKGPKFIEGVVNLRGTVIPIVDLRRRFDLPAEDHDGRRIIILAVEGRTIGLIVDGVTDVLRVRRGDIRPASGLLAGDRAPYFHGVYHTEGRTFVLLNVKTVVSTDEVISVPTSGELSQENW